MGQSASFLLTDLYQLAMMQAYCEAGKTGTAVFEFFVRKLPETRGFLVAAGLEQALDFLETLHVSQAELDWLKRSGHVGRSLMEGWRDCLTSGSRYPVEIAPALVALAREADRIVDCT